MTHLSIGQDQRDRIAIRLPLSIEGPSPPGCIPQLGASPRTGERRSSNFDWLPTSLVLNRRQRWATVYRTPDLVRNVGNSRWFGEIAVAIALTFSALLFWPYLSQLAMSREAGSAEALRSLTLMPLGLNNERRTDHAGYEPTLAPPSDRPQLKLTATLEQGEGIDHVLVRAGVGAAESAMVRDLIASKVALARIEPGRSIDLVLDARQSPGQHRVFESLKMRAGFDQELSVERREGQLAIVVAPLAVDSTPLRIRGTVGESFTRSALAAGAPPPIIQRYLQALDANSVLAGDLRPGDTFDLVVGYKRAAGGEIQAGDLLLARLERGGRTLVELLNWGGKDAFIPASGLAKSAPHGDGTFWPLNGRVSSSYGLRMHPILGYARMHSGIDLAAAWGTPIRAVRDGLVTYAGWHGGHGEYVLVKHEGGLASGYGHMSRIAVRAGAFVHAGEVIGYVGATGLATGPHLHFELFRGGRPINPLDPELTGAAQAFAARNWAAFRARLARLKQLVPGAALESL